MLREMVLDRTDLRVKALGFEASQSRKDNLDITKQAFLSLSWRVG